jgi:hypothetical protein
MYMTKCQMTRAPTCVALIEELRYNLWDEVFDGTGDGKVIIGVGPTCISGHFRDKRGAFLYAQIERPSLWALISPRVSTFAPPNTRESFSKLLRRVSTKKAGSKPILEATSIRSNLGSSYVRHAFRSSVPFVDSVLG